MRQIRVLYDTTWATGSGGTARYAWSLAEALDRDAGIEVVRVRAPRLTRGPRLLRLPINGVLHLGWTQFVLPVLALVRRADIIQASMTAPVVSPRPVVLTLHDALDFLPDLRPSRVWSAYMRTVGALAARRATVVLTGSRASTVEITRWYRLDTRRVKVTPYRTSLSVTLSDGYPGDPFVLMVGIADRRKDIGTGLRAVEIVRRDGVELRTVVVGSVPDAYASMPWVSVQAGVTDAELALMYAGALAVVVPSRHEGFGLPVVEALAFGTPVVASDLPALREVGGEAARYAQVGDAEGFARELAAIAADPIAARRLIEAAGPRVTTWDETARATVAVYHEALECRR